MRKVWLCIFYALCIFTIVFSLALLPMCFGFGEGASLRSPMALAVIGGLFTSTLMTLVVIPCVYYIFDKKVKNVEKI